MRTSTTLIAYAGGLAVVFAAALGVGTVTGSPIDMTSTHTDSHSAAAPTAAPDADVPAGLQVSQDGYTLGEVTSPTRAGESGTLSFRVQDADGNPVREFAELHGKQLHLIVVRADTSRFRHVHPTLGPDGTWSIDWTWPTGGTYRVFADFQASGAPGQLTLGRNVDVAGDLEPAPLPAASRTATVDGYTVTLDGDLTTAGGPLTLRVTRDGVPVTDLDPYLGAYGHLVALRTGDLAYLHVHPEGEPGDGVTAPGPDVTFHAQAPTAGTYRLFLDFQHEGTVRTAEFTVPVGPTAAAPATESAPAPARHDGHEGGH
ncbi:hypothetical protein EGT67_05710 [Prescottella agglutinans]|uniref:Heavy metal-binding domain-containing protein n=1 Tax=Prescottella agglutinans TaxID=1644129 RepID=A0A3S3AX83_9NOCA|nr:hypothetical protein [Prescottella agglutinans]RVW10650.1 hypothetical protein EGT67_05710 [Prescottella agglutinans]